MPATRTDQQTVETHAAVEQFLFAEAKLLDARDYAGWLKLFTPDAYYWIPAGVNTNDPAREVSIVYDDTQFLAERVWRLDSGQAFAQEPLSRTARLVTNIRIEDGDDVEDGFGAPAHDDEVRVSATFLVAEYRRGAQQHHAGRYRYRLRRAGEELQIGLKKVELISNDGHLGNLSLLL